MSSKTHLQEIMYEKHKFVDFNNKDFVNGKRKLSNTVEIIENVRSQIFFIPLFSLLLTAIFLLGILIGCFYIIIDSILFSFSFFGILFSIVLTVIIVFYLRGLKMAFRFRSGINDEQLLSNVIQYGDITSGVIIEKTEEFLTFEFDIPDQNEVERWDFKTDYIDKFSEGDKVTVLYKINLFAVLL